MYWVLYIYFFQFFHINFVTVLGRSGFYMSQMLYMYGSMDPRVRPIVFAVRRWARDRHITSPYAGRWVTNFSLTVMVLFYLMNVSPPVIASLLSLNVNSGNNLMDILITICKVACVFGLFFFYIVLLLDAGCYYSVI